MAGPVPLVFELRPSPAVRRRMDAEVLLRAALGWLLLGALWLAA
jgi:hypothetical protein